MQSKKETLPFPFLLPFKLTTVASYWPHPTENLEPGSLLWYRAEKKWARMDLRANRPRTAHFFHPETSISGFPHATIPLSPEKKWTLGYKKCCFQVSVKNGDRVPRCSYPAGGVAQWYDHFRALWKILKKLNAHPSYDPVILYFSRVMKVSHKNNFTKMFIVLFS